MSTNVTVSPATTVSVGDRLNIDISPVVSGENTVISEAVEELLAIFTSLIPGRSISAVLLIIVPDDVPHAIWAYTVIEPVLLAITSERVHVIDCPVTITQVL